MRKTLLFLLLMCLPILGKAQTKESQKQPDSLYLEVKDIGKQLAKKFVGEIYCWGEVAR